MEGSSDDQIVTLKGRQYHVLDDLFGLMDEDLFYSVGEECLGRSSQFFVDAYAKAHLERYGREFTGIACAGCFPYIPEDQPIQTHDGPGR